MSMYGKDSKEFRAEELVLQDTLDVIDQNLDECDVRRARASRTLDPRVAQELLAMADKDEKNLRRAKDSPYFARIDFCEEGGTLEALYIGKTSVIDEEMCQRVIDYRAPISSMVYGYGIGEAEYKCPDGVIHGEITLKRQYEIKSGVLENMADVDTYTSDALLLQSLGESSDARLKNIAATIQKEQDAIIRQPFRKNIIVQGVAGSGKTTVALQRISYLLYNYLKTLKPEDVMILAPNALFLNYVALSLPDMDVTDIQQYTFERFVSEFIGSNVDILPADRIARMIANGEDAASEIAISQFKTSMEMKAICDQYIDSMVELVCHSITDLTCCGEIIYTKQFIVDRFKKCSGSIEKRIELVKEFLNRDIKDKYTYYESTLGYATSKELRKNGKKLINQVFAGVKSGNVLKQYKTMIDLWAKKTSTSFAKEIQKNLASNVKVGKVSFEDLAAIAYLQLKIFGVKDFNIPKYVVIDEAQDYGSFYFAFIKELIGNNGNMMLVGDIAQGIYDYRGTANWKDVNRDVFEGNAEIMYLTKTYRTTVEIMTEANRIVTTYLKPNMDIELAQPVIRHGKAVDYQQAADIVSGASIIAKMVSEATGSLAVITKDFSEARAIYSKLSEKVDCSLVDELTQELDSQLVILPAHLSKGLEFDNVILYNVNNEQHSNDVWNKKLLYVAMTRAVHNLHVIDVN